MNCCPPPAELSSEEERIWENSEWREERYCAEGGEEIRSKRRFVDVMVVVWIAAKVMGRRRRDIISGVSSSCLDSAVAREICQAM